ncbi:MAG: protein kinase domain-containing protein [Planctomycetota bacterium]
MGIQDSGEFIDKTQSASAPPQELNAIIAEFLENAESNNSSELLEEFCARYPQYANKIRKRVESLRRLGLVGTNNASSPFPEQLGEYKLIRSLGGGGMGVVYEAEQVSLARTVALKLIRPENLYFEVSRERFKREVEAVARLQHPCIVPIYTVGDEQGVPYFVMERVYGKTLGEVLEKLGSKQPYRLAGMDILKTIEDGSSAKPAQNKLYFQKSWTDVCVAIARDVASALAHAHERGVLHRDVKPSNIMITPGGRVLLMDFGLAVAEGTSRLTKTGARIGSLPYSPPERLLGGGRAPDARSDVYSLGATLYELLTLQLPYYDESSDATVRKIMEGDAEPIRRYNRTVSAEVATVCMKAMEKDPARRYASMEAFERDLTNIIEKRPIEARPPGALRKLQKWTERNPATSVAAVLGTLILVGGPLGYAYQQNAARIELEGKNTELKAQTTLANNAKEAAETEKKRAQADFEVASNAINRMLTRIAEDRFKYNPEFEEIRGEVLAEALKLWEDFLKNHESDANVRFETAEAVQRVAEIQFERGNASAAIAATQKQIELLRLLVKDSPNNTNYRNKLVGALTDHGVYLNYNLNVNEARKLFDEAVALGRESIEKSPEDEGLKALLAAALDFSGVNYRDISKFNECLLDFEESERLFREVLPIASNSEDVKHNLALVLSHHGQALNYLRKPAEACEVLKEAVALLKDISKDAGTSPAILQVLSNSLQIYAICCITLGRPLEGEELYREALPISEKLAATYPYNTPMRQMYADQLTGMGVCLGQQKKNRDAESSFIRATAEYAKLIEEGVAMPQMHHSVAAVNNNLGRMYLLENEFEKARPRFEKAILEERKALAMNPSSFIYKDFVSQLTVNLGFAWLGLKNYTKALECADEVSELAKADFFKLEMAAQLWMGCYNYSKDSHPGTDAEKAAEAARCKETVLRLLRESTDAGLPDEKRLLRDDYKSIANEPEFQSILEKLKQRGADASGKKQ